MSASKNSVVEAGAAGFKLHEDWGTTPAAIDACLTFADEHDVAVTIHTDTLNESGFVDDSRGAIKGRTIHTYHSEGAGGGSSATASSASRRMRATMSRPMALAAPTEV